MFTDAAEKLVAPEAAKKAEPEFLRKVQGEKSTRHNEKTVWPRSIEKMSNLNERLADMDEMGVDVQVISPSPTQYYYWANDELAEEIVEKINTNIVEQCSWHPERLVPTGTVAMQNPKLAVKQLRHCINDLGMVGVEISNLINGVEISDSRYDEFWSTAELLGCPVFIHPLGTSLGERVNEYYLANIIGQPLETTITLSKLILSGAFDRYPGLKLIAAHGGGYLPGYFGRIDHGYKVRPEARTCKDTPSSYLRKIWFDSVVYSPELLNQLIEIVGGSKVMIGTDYPFDMGIDDVHSLVEGVKGLAPTSMKDILGRNALELYKPLMDKWLKINEIKESA